jgi:hypothetical protein
MVFPPLTEGPLDGVNPRDFKLLCQFNRSFGADVNAA